MINTLVVFICHQLHSNEVLFLGYRRLPSVILQNYVFIV